jgi:hypothetical protein
MVKTMLFWLSSVLTGVGDVEGWEAGNSESNAHVQGYARCSCATLWSREGSDASWRLLAKLSAELLRMTEWSCRPVDTNSEASGESMSCEPGNFSE